jgi:hypothetical protein
VSSLTEHTSQAQTGFDDCLRYRVRSLSTLAVPLLSLPSSRALPPMLGNFGLHPRCVGGCNAICRNQTQCDSTAGVTLLG